ncbi:hypothetical protein F5Y06DRAFT_158346 [Hypoxylon sp. FL0890]|nr:hypothetical protein F5Y06DRAFT_158346 [Hypoxylon sp. FL0890]
MKNFAVVAPVLVTSVVLFIILYIVRVAFLSPLSKIPNAHWSSGFSSAWILWHRWNGRELQRAVEAHRKRGPILRLGPNDLSVSCYEEGIRKIYGGGFDKPVYFDFFSYYGTSNSFCSRTREQHSFHRRRMSTPYTKSSLFSSLELLAMTRRTLYERVIPRLQHESKTGCPTEMLELSYALCLDLVTQFIFGFFNASNFLQAPANETLEWLEHYERRYCKESFWSQEVPHVSRLLNFFGVGLMPVGHADSTKWLENWMVKMCDGAEQTLREKPSRPEDVPLVFGPINTVYMKDFPEPDSASRRQAVASELFDHIVRGTGGIGIGPRLHHLLHRAPPNGPADIKRRAKSSAIGHESTWGRASEWLQDLHAPSNSLGQAALHICCGEGEPSNAPKQHPATQDYAKGPQRDSSWLREHTARDKSQLVPMVHTPKSLQVRRRR